MENELTKIKANTFTYDGETRNIKLPIEDNMWWDGTDFCVRAEDDSVYRFRGAYVSALNYEFSLDANTEENIYMQPEGKMWRKEDTE